jgi:branched-chain amino acid transport system ATP-binding protein
MLRIENLEKSFGGNRVTRSVSTHFPKGSLSSVIGPNGAGKTTLFNLIAGRLRPNSGRILLEGAEISGLSEVQIVRRGIARAFQVASLFPTFTTRKTIEAAVVARGQGFASFWPAFPSKSAAARADEILSLLRLQRVADTLSGILSHGDRKLLDIAIALALDPKVLLLDEPTAGMGPDERWEMVDRVHALWKASGLTLIFIEHDIDIVFKISQTVRVLSYGALLAEGPPDEIRNNPKVIEAYLGSEVDDVA